MVEQPTEKSSESRQHGFSEPSEDVKRRNRITGVIILAFILGMIATGMLVRVFGS